MLYKTKNRSDWYQAAFQTTYFKSYFTRLYSKVEDSTSNLSDSGWRL